MVDITEAAFRAAQKKAGELGYALSDTALMAIINALFMPPLQEPEAIEEGRDFGQEIDELRSFVIATDQRITKLFHKYFKSDLEVANGATAVNPEGV